MGRLFGLIIFCFFSIQLFSQKKDKTTLIKNINKEHNPIKKINLMIDLTYNYLDSDTTNFIKLMKDIESYSISNNYFKGLGEYYYRFGDYYYKKGKYKISITNYRKSIPYFQKISNKKRVADAFTCIGVNYSELTMYNDAIEPYINSEKLYQEIHDTTGLIQSLINLSANYDDIKLNEKAKKYINKALELSLKQKDFESAAYCYLNLGIYEKKEGNFDKALENYIKVETYSTQCSNNYLLSHAYVNISSLFLEKKEPYKALQFANKYFRLNINSKEPSILYQINSLFKAFNNAKEINTGNLIINASSNLADAYKTISKFDKAYYYIELAYNYSDSIFRADNLKQITEVETKYQTEKKEHEIEVLNKNKKLQTLELDKKQREIKQRNFIIYGIGLVLLIIIGFSVMLYNTLQQKRKANKLLNQKNNEIQQKNEEILSQRDEIQAQRDEVILHRDKIASQQKKITDSILYASRIQNAVLPPLENINILLPEHFILFKPRDIVSGDFYWIQQIKNRTYIAVADCTGHGVPGAFMSMLGVAFLNEIITKFNNPIAGDILNQLRINVKRSLHQTGRVGEQKDGMDISLCVIDKDKNQLEFSGANNPLYIVSSQQSVVGSQQSDCELKTEYCGLIELKGDKMPIGVYTTDDKLFNTQYYSYNTGDTFYMFSDGYADQFGGIDGKKFMKSRFKKFLLEINNLSVNEQQKQLEYNIERWMGNNEQIDDILVVGVRFV